jgi:hypothetical protein
MSVGFSCRGIVKTVQTSLSTSNIDRFGILLGLRFGGKLMQGYETKIIGSAGTVRLQVSKRHETDFSAIRAAKKMCAVGECVEVWRDDMCIYNERANEPLGLIWPAVPPLHTEIDRYTSKNRN